MTDPSRGAAGRPDATDRRRLRLHAAAATVLLCLVGVLTAVTLDLPAAGASGRHTAHGTATRTVHVKLTRSATITARATVDGHTSSATATARAIGTATAIASASARATAARASVAKATAQRRATARATTEARRAAIARAARRARAAAVTIARGRAAAQASQEATTLAAGAPAAGVGSSDPGTSDTGPGTGGTGGTSGGSGTGTSGGTSGPTCGDETPPLKADGSTWICSFDDEFGGTTLDTKRWTVQQTAGSGFAPASVCYLNNQNTVAVSDGMLNLSVVRTPSAFACPSPYGDFTTDYAGGEVMTLNTFSQTYGRFAIRAKLPPATVAGLQETFWLWPEDQSVYGAWPRSGEIDLAEFYSQYAGWTIPYLHYDYDQSTVSWATNTNVVTALPAPYNQPGMNCTIDQSAFNTYTLDWLPGRLTISVNGNACIVDNYRSSDLSGAAPFDQPFFLALTQALGIGSNAPTAATPLPATTQVDYVRVWK